MSNIYLLNSVSQKTHSVYDVVALTGLVVGVIAALILFMDGRTIANMRMSEQFYTLIISLVFIFLPVLILGFRREGTTLRLLALSLLGIEIVYFMVFVIGYYVFYAFLSPLTYLYLFIFGYAIVSTVKNTNKNDQISVAARKTGNRTSYIFAGVLLVVVLFFSIVIFSTFNIL